MYTGNQEPAPTYGAGHGVDQDGWRKDKDTGMHGSQDGQPGLVEPRLCGTRDHGATAHHKIEKKDTEHTHVLKTGQDIDKSTEKELSRPIIEQNVSRGLRDIDTQNTGATGLDMGNNKDKSNPTKEEKTNSKGTDEGESQTYKKEEEKHDAENNMAEELIKHEQHDQSKKTDIAKKGNNKAVQTTPENDFFVQKVGDFVVINHVKSGFKAQIGCKGMYEYKLNILSCNGKCYDVRYEKNKITLMTIVEADIEDNESQNDFTDQTPDDQSYNTGADDLTKQTSTEASQPSNIPSPAAQAGELNTKHCILLLQSMPQKEVSKKHFFNLVCT